MLTPLGCVKLYGLANYPFYAQYVKYVTVSTYAFRGRTDSVLVSCI